MLNHKTFFKMVYVKNKTRSKYKCTFFLIRSLVLYGSVFRAGVWAGEWCRAQPCCKQRVPRSLGEDEPSQSFFFICAGFQGGRGLVSTEIKLILAIKISPPFSFHHFPVESPTECPDGCTAVLVKPLQAASLALSIPQSGDIIHFFQKAGNVLFNLSGV